MANVTGQTKKDGSLLYRTVTCRHTTTMANTDIPEQLKRLEIPGRATMVEGNGELPRIQVTSDHATAEIYLHGAHVTDFQRKGEPPLLFMSQCSRFAVDQPIRGGVPIIFPWFGPREGAPAHGFARQSAWNLNEITTQPDGGVSLRFGFPASALSTMGPPCAAYYVVTVTDCLRMELRVVNTSPDQPFSFENCLHTYFAVADIQAVSVHGLKGVVYQDKVDNFSRKTETADALIVTGETDRVYLDTTGATEIHDPGLRRRIVIEKTGSASTVVWNPWIAKAQQMADFGNDEYRRMICVESGNVADNRLTLAPGETSTLSVTISSALL